MTTSSPTVPAPPAVRRRPTGAPLALPSLSALGTTLTSLPDGATLRLAAGAGLLATQVLLLLAPEQPFLSVLLQALKVALGAWIVLTLIRAALALLPFPAALTPSHPSPPTSLLLPFAIVLTTIILVPLLTLPSVGRFTATLVCYLVLALALSWTLWRRAGAIPATRALLAFSLFATLAAATDLRVQPRIEETRPDSPYRWTAGWPTAAWRLRHEVAPPAPLPDRPMTLKVPLAAAYAGPTRVYATLNDHELGPATLVDRWHLHFPVPAALIHAQPRLTIVLRQEPPDPRLRISAHRWGNAATAGPGASSYFDGLRWTPGTFNDALGRPLPGIYILQLDPQ